MDFPRKGLALTATLLAAALSMGAAEPEASDKDMPRVPPTEPDKALSTFQIKPGFRLELAAAEPLVVSPIAMSFDENGRLFVVEMRDYPEARNETPHLGRIRMLEDTDGDGKFDKSTVYVDNLPWPTAVICWNGGVFVGATPDIIYCKDTNGDGVADTRETVFTGIAGSYAPYDVKKLNVQALFNSFTWGLDNRIYAANGGDGGAIVSLKHPGTAPLELRGHDFSFDPRSLTVRLESGGGQYGLSFDSRGREFVCSNSSHIRQIMYPDLYAGRNPYYNMPPPAVDIAVDGPAAEVYRLSPDEPWRVLRTQWRVAGLVPGPVEGGGRPSGYFTGATGITVYRGGVFPEDFDDNAFIADAGSNLVHRKKLYQDAIQLAAKRPDDEQKIEFLASRDNWFRPVQMANAPDGALYIADMYRETIEHPWSLPDSLKKRLDLTSGRDRGRIYRIVPEGYKQPKPARLESKTPREWVELLESKNGWQRDAAARLIYQRQDRSVAGPLERLARNSRSPIGRMHGLYALDGLGALRLEIISAALGDSSPMVREHAIRISEKMFATQSSTASPLAPQLRALARDADPLVRCQLAYTAGALPTADAAEVLSEIAVRDAADPWVRTAVLDSSASVGVELLSRLVAHRDFCASAPGQEFLSQLARTIGAKNAQGEIGAVIDFASAHVGNALHFVVARGLGDGLRAAGSSLMASDRSGALALLFSRAALIAADSQTSDTIRIQAIQLLAMGRYEDAVEALTPLLGGNGSDSIQLAASAAMGRFANREVAAQLLKPWFRLRANVRSGVLATLMGRPERIQRLLDAVADQTVLPSELSAAQLQALRNHNDLAIRERALALLGAPPPRRNEVVASFLSALAMKGSAANGHKIYMDRCSTCHRAGGEGHQVGPDLASVKASGKENLLINILDPNREVAPRFLNYTVETKSGETVSGILVGETPSSLTLRGANGIETVIPKSQSARIQTSSQSLMPEGLEAGLKPEDLADLLEFIEKME